ncbi:unnamed protein product [Prorocentrum cordatum]|uniref:Uncharacterized protein n=1 Tax=Prorocentrum cordatum TaxID=2364126 RepID=A0ABN9WG46_9DINO|nr:unnamed protein product [Polarella glacialis]
MAQWSDGIIMHEALRAWQLSGTSHSHVSPGVSSSSSSAPSYPSSSPSAYTTSNGPVLRALALVPEEVEAVARRAAGQPGVAIKRFSVRALCHQRLQVRAPTQQCCTPLLLVALVTTILFVLLLVPIVTSIFDPKERKFPSVRLGAGKRCRCALI